MSPGSPRDASAGRALRRLQPGRARRRPHLLPAPGANRAGLRQRAGAQRHHAGAQRAGASPLGGAPAGRHQAQHCAARLVVGAPVIDLNAVGQAQLHHAAVAGRAHGAVGGARQVGAAAAGTVEWHKARLALRHQRLDRVIGQQSVGHLQKEAEQVWERARYRCQG